MTSSQPAALPDDNPAAPRSIGRKIGSVLLGMCVPVPRGKTTRSKAWWIGRRIALLYLIILFIFAFFQRDLIYQPSRADAIDPRLSGLEPRRIEEVRVPTADGLQLNGWLVRAFPTPRDAQQNGSVHPAVIWFPGNAGHRGYRALELDQLSRLGADAYLVDYRGYGDNPGRPTEENLEADARAVWKFVTTSQHVQPSQVVLLGESLGGGVATRLASELSQADTPPGGLILCATYSGLADVAFYQYPWLPAKMILIDRFPSAEWIAHVTCPVLVLHCKADDTVPFESGKRLFDAAPAVSAGSVPKTFVVLPGAHHIPLFAAGEPYREAVKEFLDRMRPASEPVRSAVAH